MSPPRRWTLLSFAALNRPIPPPGFKPVRTRHLSPHRWCEVHLKALRVVVCQHKPYTCPGSLSLSGRSTTRNDGRENLRRAIEQFLRTLDRPPEDSVLLFTVAWSLSGLLNPTPNADPDWTPPPLYRNTQILRSFLDMASAIIQPRLHLISQGDPIHCNFYSRPLRYRQFLTWISPDMCIFRDTRYGALPYFIPVRFPEIHGRPRNPLAYNIAYIIAHAQRRFRDSDAVKSMIGVLSLVRVVVLSFSPKETFFVGADVKRSYLESLEKTGAAASKLKIWTSGKWDLETYEGRVGFLAGMKMVFVKMFPPVSIGPGYGIKRKWEEIS